MLIDRCRGLLVAVLVAASAVSAWAAEPPSRQRRWGVSICAPYLKGLAEDVWSAGRSVGITRLEIYLNQELACPHLYEGDKTPYTLATTEGVTALREALERQRFTAGCIAMPMKLERDGAGDDQALARIRKAAEAAPRLGNPCIMLPIGINLPKGEQMTPEAFVERMKPFVRALDRIAAETKVQIVLENLGHYWNRPEVLEPVLRESTPDRVGLLLDITNMYWYGHPLDSLYGLAERFAPFIRYMHVKNIRYPEEKQNAPRPPGWEYGKYAEPVPTGDVDFARIVDIVARAGYVGDLTIEDDSLGHFDVEGKKKAVRDDVALLKELIRRQDKRK